MHLENVYQQLPTFLQNVACSLIGWQIQRTRFGPGFRRHLRLAEERAGWSKDRLLAYRDQQLQAFVRYCAASVPYYQDLFKQHGVDPQQIRTLEDLQQLPVLTKQQVQCRCPKPPADRIPRKQRLTAHTSGTTGSGLRFTTTLDAVQQQWAVWWRYRRWHDIQPDTWCGYFGGRSVVPLSQRRPPFWRRNVPGRQILFSGYHLSPENAPFYLAELRRRRPPWIHGYPSLLALLAAYLLDSRGDLGYQVSQITVGAENLLPQQAALIERAMGRRPKQNYGMAEAVANMSECECGRLHVDEDFAAVEFLPNSAGPGCHVIGTNFSNPATPLLRYDTQDLATVSDEPCPCGRPGRVVGEIDGRREDYVVLKGGARLGRLDHIFKDLVNIREAQIHQRQVGAITLRVVRGQAYGPADEQRLLQETRQRLGEQTEVTIEYVDALQRSASGKLRVVVSDLEQGRLEACS
ncbi:MAG: phenylacetate--CoA ligase family protein [Pirellulales bacterium]|nr:phenylacetate--CoA ligase family protein [Pirellulales bacterium]